MKSTNLTLQVESWPIERLIPYARNARTHSEGQVAQIAGSIAEFGFNNPVLTDPDGGIIAGHGRVLAARRLGFSHIPVIVLGHLDENQKRAFIIADNKIANNAGWDEEKLQLELEALAAADYELDKLGFNERELRELIETERSIDQDELPPVEPQPVTRRGDVWMMGDHQLLCGDATCSSDVRQALRDQLCDMVFTDLPYNVDYTGKTAAKMKLANDNLKADFGQFLLAACSSMMSVCQGPLYLCMSSSELHRLHTAFTAAGGHWSTYIIWVKNTFTLGRADYQRQYEPILYGWPEGRNHFWCGDRNQGDVWFVDKPHANDLHPTMKPVELVERAIRNSSRKNAIVLDPFAGSGSTIIACENLGRRACGIELDPKYADVIVRRWQNYSGRAAHLEQDGPTFDQVANERNGEAESKEPQA